ncbi:MAG: hypothetical protein HKM07_02505 [Chlamydiae bacterium]|nr:hypothetical protein [Chlamydiota bacterium]
MTASENYERIADAITAETAKKLQNEKELILTGTGRQMMMMGFNFYEAVNSEIARKLLICCVEEYLSAINNNEKIRPYLHEYPFTDKNVKIVIYFYNSDGSDVSSDRISVAAISKGIVTYYVKTSDNQPLKDIHEETYQEALKLDQK